MCGIAGFIDTHLEWDAQQLNSIGRQMTGRIAHRGPDDEGVWVDPLSGVVLGNRRLAIIDLSADGHQPMHSKNGRYTIVFNGEIYNFPTLRHSLQEQYHHQFKGSSDTEVLLELIAYEGLQKALSQCVGMFAFALWDRLEKTLTIARDRLGEKPLYYGWANGQFLFGSELKSMTIHPQWVGQIDHNVVALYLRYRYIPTPYSIYQNIYKLQPGSSLTLHQPTLKENQLPDIEPYWSLSEVAQQGQNQPFTGTPAEALDELEKRLTESVCSQMIADVPLGAFLSGGVDSSTIVALMQANSSKPTKTFTIGFDNKEYNEAEYALAVAKHLQTDHTELYVDKKTILDVIPLLPSMYDEPFADSSQIPTFLVSQLAKQKVTVSLSGDGGDELFGGYNRYKLALDAWSKLNKIPSRGRPLLAKALQKIPVAVLDIALRPLEKPAGTYGRRGLTSQQIQRFTEYIDIKNFEAFYQRFLSLWKNPNQLVINGHEYQTLLHHTNSKNFKDLNHFMMFVDASLYLPDDILVKVDRASMWTSLESRIPLLDHRIVEFAWSLPLDLKIREKQSKWLLRQLLYKYVPKQLIDRPKVGFAIPLDIWLRNELRDWAGDLLNSRQIKSEGIFNHTMIQDTWNQHIYNKKDMGAYLWTILMFQSWL